MKTGMEEKDGDSYSQPASGRGGRVSRQKHDSGQKERKISAVRYGLLSMQRALPLIKSRCPFFPTAFSGSAPWQLPSS